MKSASLIFVFDCQISLNDYSIFDVGTGKPYINWDKTQSLFAKQYEKNIKKELDHLVDLSVGGKLQSSAYFSGYFLNMLEKVDAQMITELKTAIKKGNIQILGGTINHSFSSIYSHLCFEWEVIAHLAKMKDKFGVIPSAFYNTENIYFDGLVELIKPLGFNTTFAGVIPWYLQGDNSQRLFTVKDEKKFHLHLIDDNTAKALENPDIKNLHFQFDLNLLEEFGGLRQIIKSLKNIELLSLSEQVKQAKPKTNFKIKSPTIGSVRNRSLSTFNGQAMQTNAFDQYYKLCTVVEGSQKPDYMDCHAELGHMSLFLQMSRNETDTKTDPYQTYSNYVNMLTDLEIRMGR